MTDSRLSRPSDPALLRVLGTWTLAAAIVNITIGGSIFAMSGMLAAMLGAYAPLVFVLGAALFAPVVACFAAAGSRVTATGGPYSYVEAAFGRLPGLATGVLLWVTCVSGSASISAALVDQLGQMAPSLAVGIPRAIVLFSVYGALVALNLRGVRAGAAVIVAFALAKTVPLVLLALAALPAMRMAHLHLGPHPSLSDVGASLVFVVFAYSGIETALVPSGEVRDAARVVPRAALLGVAAVIGLYVGMQWTTLGVLGARLAGDATPLATLAEALRPGAGVWLVLAAAVSLIGTLQGDLLGTSRLLYALASDGYLPVALARVGSRHRVPIAAIVVHAACGWMLAVGGTFRALALVAGGAFCFVYMGCCAAAWRLQKSHVQMAGKPLRLPGGALLPGIAIAGLAFVLLALGRSEWIAIACAAFLVLALHTLRRWRGFVARGLK